MSVFDSEWLAWASNGVWTHLPSESVSDISHDTRKLGRSSLYVALRGERYDGHDFVENAFENGAAAAMVDHTSFPSKLANQPLLVVDQTDAAMARLAHQHRLRVNPLVIGVTGSVGKTSVKEMTASVLSAVAPTTRTLGNFNNHIGLPSSMLRLQDDSRFGVFELGMNHPGEIRKLSEVLQPDWGIVTAIGPVHLEFFESVDAIAVEKGQLLQALSVNGKALLCSDDPWFDSLFKMASCPVYTVSSTHDADIHVDGSSLPGHLRITERDTHETVVLVWPWVGAYHAVNAGMAILAGRLAGASWEQIEQGLERYQPLSMRWEKIKLGSLTIINDAYNANPMSMQGALDTFAREPCEGQRWLVLGDMLEIGRSAVEAHRQIGERIACDNGCRGLLAIGSLASKIVEGAREHGMSPECLWECSTVEDAATILLEHCSLNDWILLKGSRGCKLEGVVDLLRKNLPDALKPSMNPPTKGV